MDETKSEDGSRRSKNGRKRILLALVATCLILGYVLPTVVYFRPFGTDAYSHMVYTQKVFESSSLNDFYAKILYESDEEELGYGYPFGLWFYGAVVAKVIGIDAYQVAYFLPLLFTFIICILVYNLSRLFLKTEEEAVLSIAFLLSIPIISIYLLRYQTTVFATPFILVMLYLNHKGNIRLRKNIPLTALCVFGLIISHTGTYLFILSFVVAYVFLKATIWGQFQRRMYSLIFILLVGYVITIDAFPNIQAQYITKATFFTSIGSSLAEKFHFPGIAEVSEVFYKEIFVNNNIIHAIMWSAVIYTICKLIIFVRAKAVSRKNTGGSVTAAILALPAGGISHSVSTTPFWIGPVQTLLSIPGFFRLNVKGKCMLLTATIVTIIPSMFSMGATGALREIFYLFVILPASAAAGFMYLIEYKSNVKHSLISMAVRTVKVISIWTIIIYVIIVPIIGNLNYLIPSSGNAYEVNSLRWLSKIGNSGEQVIGFGYRHMVDVYAGKPNPQVSSGNENILYMQNLLNIFFSKNGEIYADGLYYSFRGDYIISSDRVIKNLAAIEPMVRARRTLAFDKLEESTIESNMNLDRIYSNERNFSIYHYIPQSYGVITLSERQPALRFDENETTLKDGGVVFLVETDTYTAQIDKKKPEIVSLTDRKTDYLGGGYMRDYVSLSFIGGSYGYSSTYYFNDPNYASITTKDNVVTYRTPLQTKSGDNIATLKVQYTFYQKAIQKDIWISNDWISSDRNFFMRTMLFNTQYSPATNQLKYYAPTGKATSKTIYPSDDTVKLEDQSFSRAYFNNGQTGMYYLYGPTNQYPDEIRYKRSAVNDYTYTSIGTKSMVNPSEAMHVTQYISLGDEEEAEKNIRRYSDITAYPFPNGDIPMIVAGYAYTIQNENVSVIFGRLRRANVTYSIGLTAQDIETTLSKQAAKQYEILGYDAVYSRGVFYNATYQEDSLSSLNQAIARSGLRIEGFIPYGLNLNHDTIGILSSGNYTYVIAQPKGAYYGPFYQEGAMDPVKLFYNGNESELILLPVTTPVASSLDPAAADDFVSSWRTNIDRSVQKGSLETMVVYPDVLAGAQAERVMEVLAYAKTKGMAFYSPRDIAKQYTLAKNVDSLVSFGNMTVTINSTNRNDAEIPGLTYSIKLPYNYGECRYQVSGASLRRKTIEYDGCRIFVSATLQPNETRQISIEPEPLATQDNAETAATYQ